MGVRGIRLVFVATLVALMLVPLTPSAAQAAAGSATTVTGTWYPWNPQAQTSTDDFGDVVYTGQYDTSARPTVTVDQTDNLVDQVVHVSWQHFPVSFDDPTQPPHPGVTPASPSLFYYDYVLECRTLTASSPNPIGQQNATNCYTAPVSSTADGGHGQNNAVNAVTQPNGSGSVDFHVENAPTNDLLGCDATHACSLVVVPNNGGDPANCADHSQDFAQAPNYDQFGYAGLAYQSSACAWADRIVVPLHFAPLPTDCPDTPPAFNAAGSPMLERGLNQLLAGWCRGANAVSFGYNSTSAEYDARAQFFSGSGSLSASTDMALVSQPADPATAAGRHFTYAPIANDAIAIPYYVDNPTTGLPITDLKLNARLVAKLLTQSYQPFHFNCQSDPTKTKQSAGCAPTVNGNPASIFDDPEFLALNHAAHPDRSDFPSSALSGNHDSLGGFFPTVVAGDTDLTWELTRWVDSDPAARAFLDGKKDPWGMHVNTSYLQGKKAPPLYPTSQFQALDPGWTAPKGSDQRFQEGFQGTWNPVSGLANVAATLVGYRSSGVDVTTGTCSNGLNDCSASQPIKFAALAPEPLGARDLWAVTDNSDAQAFRFPTAELVNDSGQAVGPTTSAMGAALRGMKTNPDGVTQYVDYRTASSAAYPLTTPVYAMVPTCGLTKAKVVGITSMLRHVVSSQTYGVRPGTLAPGLHTLTATQIVQTDAAIKAVSTRSCTAPSTVVKPARRHSQGTHRSASGPVSSANVATTASTAPAVKTTPTTTVRTPTTSSAPRSAPDEGSKPVSNAMSLNLALPILLLVGLLFILGTPLTWWLATTPAGRHAVRRLRAPLRRSR